MINYFQALVFGLLQGITELFPISSLGHSVILPKLLGWNIDQSADSFLIFLVVTHLATAIVLLLFFLKDWILIVKGIFRSLKLRMISNDDVYARAGWLLVVGTIPAGLLGLLFQEKLQTLFASSKYVAIFLCLNGLVLYGAEILRRRKSRNVEEGEDEKISKMKWTEAVAVGLGQALALIPGFSRTGSAMAAGLLTGLDHPAAARFSFLLATPIILAAAVLKLPELFAANNSGLLGPILVGALAAALAAYLSVRYLTKYFKTKTLTPFAVYCVLLGVICSILFFR